MTANLISLPFQGDTLTYMIQGGEQMVPMRPICENLGLDWKSQHRKLTSGDRPWGCGHMTTHDASGRAQEMLCLPVFMLPAWLFSVSPSKVRPELRDKLVAYQAECARVLYRHFMDGDAKHHGVIKELALSKRFNRNLTTQLLAAKPLWNRIMRYHEGNYWRNSIKLMVGRSEPSFSTEWEAMQDCGLVPDYPGEPDKQLRLALEEADG